jgi:AraC-like DNA-binding protein
MASRRAKRPRSLTSKLSIVPPLPALLAPLRDWQALLSLVVANAFEELQVSVALWMKGDWWYPIKIVEGQGILAFEYAYGVGARRWAYNARCFDRVRNEHRSVRGEHGGFSDLFVPIEVERQLHGVFVAGPFSTAWPSSADIQARWSDMTGSQGRLTDPTFSHYLSTNLSTLTLEDPLPADFERLLTCLVGLVSGQGSAETLGAQAYALRQKLVLARVAERMWDFARQVLDEKTAPNWAAHAHGDMAVLGLEQVPEHAIVGLLLGRTDEPDPIDEALRRHAFLRACVALARKLGNVASGQVGDHGVTFLVHHPGPPSATRARLLEVTNLAAITARRFGFRLHAGISQNADRSPLVDRYREALSAAEKALSQRRSIALGVGRAEGSAEQLRSLRRELAESVVDRPNLLSPRFDRYIEAVLSHCGYRVEPTRAELAAGFERLAEPMLAKGSLDRRSFNDLCRAAESSLAGVRTVTDLVAKYRSLVSDMEAALRSPTGARQERGTRRALGYIRDHLGDALTLEEVAKVAGFAPNYFSRLFRLDEGVTFAHYVQRLRVERAKQMLKTNILGVEEIRKLCGFRTRTYFHRVFKTSTGLTPAAYREQGA